MQFYEIGKCYDFEVVQTEDLSESFFRLRLHDGVTEVKLPKIKFQMEKPLPSRLKCRIKGIDNGRPIVDHYIPQYVSKFYAKGAARHEIFSFTVISVPTRAEDPFYLRDANGIIFRLYEQGAILSLNQTVKCRFEKLDSIKFILKRVDDGLQLPFLTLDEICEQLKIRSFERKFISETLMKMPALSGAAEELVASNPRWPLTFLHLLEQHFAEWFISADVRRRYRAVRKLFTYYREAALLLLEGSHFLSNCNDVIRRNMQLQLTELIEMVDPYLTSLKIINEGNQAEFVEGLMDKLRKSGYLYHPTLQFAILMLVFRLYPELVDKYLSKIFDVIMSRNLSTWTTDTFSNAFVEQFEIYIRQARHAIDDLPQAESQDENHRLETIITAIALQLFMAKSETFPAFDRNAALFYRYISLLRPVKARDLLTKSFLSLLGVNMPHNFGYDDIKEPIKMMTLATVMPQMLEESALQALPTTHMLTSGKIALKISKDGIELRRIDMPTNERVIPNGVMEWLQPQIYHNGITPIKSNKLDNHNKWWREIENDLFGAKPIINSNIREHRRQALVGDDVYVIVTGTGYDDKGNPKLFCRIDDDEYDSVSGCILREQIVGYRVPQISRDAYVNEHGVPFHFYAKVIDIEPDGNYQFSLKSEADKAIRELVDYQTEYYAVITSEPSPDYSAICSEGFGLYLIHNKGEDYNVTDKVKFRIVDSVNGIYRGEILGDAVDLDYVDNVRAFTNLMNEMALEPSDDEMVDADQYSSGVSIDNYEELNKEDLKEIIEIIRFKALLDKELVEAFDYLNFARILALLIDEKETADKLGAHASMLIMHEYFATNSRIDSDKLKALEPIVETNPLLKIIYKRLEIVSWLGDKERMSDLLDIIKDARNELEANLARMVLSYNMILETESADSQIADSIRKKIMTLLKVNSETRQLKYYGSESLYVEFKSSIVYPARRKGEKLTPDPDAQQFIILKVIASFLNAGGGTLFIGVNDATHYESGLQNDFDYYRNHVAQVGPYINKIKDADNVAVFLANLVNHVFGDAIGRLVEIAPDPEAKKDVIVVKVKQTLDPVQLNGAYYERQSSTIRELRHPEDQRRFLADRKAQKLLQAVRNKTDVKEEQDLIADEPKAVDVEGQKPKVKPLLDVSPMSEETIATSSWRENALHYYSDNYVTPKAYIYFGDGSSVKYTEEDTYEDDKSRLTLVVKDSEIDAYLVLIFADERAIKVPIDELLRLNPREQLRYDSERPLVFAGIAHAKDAVLSIHSDARNALWQRVTPLKSIESGHIGNSPTRIMDVAVNETLRYEIVDASKTKQFAKSMPDEIRTNDIGFNMHRKTDGMNTPETIQELIEMCAPVKD